MRLGSTPRSSKPVGPLKRSGQGVRLPPLPFSPWRAAGPSCQENGMKLSERLQHDGRLAEMVRSTEPLLQERLGQSASASWDLTADPRGRPALALELRDPSQAPFTARFNLEEFNWPGHIAE